MLTPSLCPCGSRQPFTRCCQPYLQGQVPAPTAEALMRSRYTAYCQGNIDYLIATHHPSQRQPGDGPLGPVFDHRASLTQTIHQTQWQGLTIVQTEQGQPTDGEGIVEFVAAYRAPMPGQLHERSHFVQEKGRWFYLKGEILPPLTPRRNQPCWCGSGNKFKHCHGATR
jgi:SEC-C motif-containing protein